MKKKPQKKIKPKTKKRAVGFDYTFTSQHATPTLSRDNPALKATSVSKAFDEINKAVHYNQGSIEVIAAIEDWKLGFHAGQVIKYVARAEHKGEPVKDLKKARYYLNRLINLLEEGKG